MKDFFSKCDQIRRKAKFLLFCGKPSFAEALECNGSCCNRNGERNRMENAPLQDMVKMNREKRGSSDVITDASSNITSVR